MHKFDEIWPRIRTMIAFCAGLGIMFYETLVDPTDRPWLYAAAVGMMGLPIAREAERVLGRISGTGPSRESTELSPEEPPKTRGRNGSSSETKG